MRVVQMHPFSSAPSYPPPAPISEVIKPEPSSPSLGKAFDFKRFKSDDWILLGIIIALILEGSEDYILLCALGYLFIMGL